MDILYFYQYFGTDKGGWSTRVYEMCKRWVAEGHKVTVVTSPYDKSDIPAFKGITKRFEYAGIEVIVLNFPMSNKHSKLKRMKSFIQYINMAVFYVFKLKYDVAIASSGPITVGFLGIMAKIFRRKKFVFEVRDLWPAGAIELGIIERNSVRKLAYWFERKCYKYADLIVACSEGMKQNIENRFHYKNIIVVPNACDTDLFQKPSAISIPPEFIGKKLVLYTGSLGVMDHCMQIMWAAKETDIQRHPDLRIVIVGDGVERKMMQEYAQKEKLDFVHFIGLVPKTQVVAWLQQAYCTIVCFKEGPILNTVSPNKMFDAFAAGLPIVQTTQGWIKELLAKEENGLTVAPDNPAEMAAAIHFYLENPALRDKHAKNSLRLALDVFNRNRCASDMLAGIESVVHPKPSKNVWVINQFAGHATSGWGERHFFMNHYWKQKGYNVSIISGSFNHMFVNLPEAPDKFNYEDVDGTRFCWIRTPKYNPKSGRRFWSQIYFAWRVFRVNAKKIGRPDYIVVSSLPIFPILSGYFLKKKYGAKKLVFEIRDIWPLTMIELNNKWKYNPIILFFSWFENFGYRNSDAIVTLLPYATPHIVTHGGKAEKVVYIPNGLEEEVLQSQPLQEDIASHLPTGKFIVGYTGTHNQANALEYLIGAAIKLKNQSDVYFVLVGDGYMKDDLQKMAQGLTNIAFVNKIPKQQIQPLLQHFDACFVGRPGSTMYDFGVSGNKYFDYMMAQKPIIDSTSATNGLVDLANCGLRVKAGSADAIAGGILALKNMTVAQRAQLGKNGKVYLEQNHSTQLLAEKYMTIFQ